MHPGERTLAVSESVNPRRLAALVAPQVVEACNRICDKIEIARPQVITGALAAAALVVAQTCEAIARQVTSDRIEYVETLALDVFVPVEWAASREHQDAGMTTVFGRRTECRRQTASGCLDLDSGLDHSDTLVGKDCHRLS